MRSVFLVCCIAFFVSISGCASSGKTVPAQETKWTHAVAQEQRVSAGKESDQHHGKYPWLSVATLTTKNFSQEYLDYLLLPASVQDRNRLLAEKAMAPYNLLMKEMEQMRQYQDSLLRPHLYPFIIKKPEYTQKRIGLNNGLKALELATTTDISFVQAWAAKGSLALQVGALHQARNSLEAALFVIEERLAAGHSMPLPVHVEIYRNLSWSLRNLGHYEAGLVQIERALDLKPGDRELLLLKGLLLAGAGHTSEAINLASALPVEEFSAVTMRVDGITMAHSGYATSWIKSQALFAVGDYQGARHVLGPRESHLLHLKHPLEFGHQYWTDVGLVYEMAEHEDAAVFYRKSDDNKNILRFFCPVNFRAGWQLIFEYPNLTLPVLSTFDYRFYVGGSFLGFISIQMNLLDSGVFPHQQEDAANRSLNALDVAERRHIVPAICQALRGRIYYKQGRYAEAKIELERARETWTARGDFDSHTSYLLGLLALNEDRDADAQVLLEEAVSHGSGEVAYYRSLGLALARQGKIDEAEIQLGKALDGDSYSVPGLYNMGLLYCKMRRFEDATKVLEQAYALDNENRDVQHLLHLAASSSRAQGNTLHSKESTSSEGDRDATKSYVAEIQKELDAVFAVNEPVESQDHGRLSLSTASKLYEKNSSHFNRKVLALALLDDKKIEDVQALLESDWGDALDPDEVIILLYADKLAGNKLRAQSLGRAILKGETGTDNPFIRVLALGSLDGKDEAGAQYALAQFARSPFTKIGASDGSYWSEFMRVGFANYRAAVHSGTKVK